MDRRGDAFGAAVSAASREAPPGARPVAEAVWRADGARAAERVLPVEIPVALVHDATATAVMMATPLDLEDFGLGFSLTEGLIDGPGRIRRMEVVEGEAGVEVRMWLDAGSTAALAARRRRLAGPTGCGLCGIDSLAEAVRAPKPVAADLRLDPADVGRALESLRRAQSLNAATRAVHAAGYWTPGEGLVVCREDVGRHNALDKVAGALARRGPVPAGAVVLTSRVSVEMVQKAAAIGAPAIIAVSAPTTLAVETAERAGLTLIAIARDDGFEVFTRPERVTERPAR
jgi:FdhD protein